MEFYHSTQNIKLPLHLRDQINRAASSISLNLAEGNAKFSYRDKSRIYQIAYGSFRECQTILRLSGMTTAEVDEVSKHLGSSLYRLIASVQAKASSN